MSANGVVTVDSTFTAAETLTRLKSALDAAGMTVFAAFDHAEAASQVGLSLGPTTVVAFGNPAAGTKLMQSNQVAGLDLPLKILVWEDEAKTARLSYNDVAWLAARHELGPETALVITAMTKLMASLTEKAAKG